jgi:pyrimidine-nucleoside phosphorylase
MFLKWISSQGGDITKLKVSDKVLEIKSNKTGVIKHVSALACGKLSLKLGAGRLAKESVIDYGVGIKLLKQTGDKVSVGDVLAELYVNNYDLKLTADDLKLFDIE